MTFNLSAAFDIRTARFARPAFMLGTTPWSLFENAWLPVWTEFNFLSFKSFKCFFGVLRHLKRRIAFILKIYLKWRNLSLKWNFSVLFLLICMIWLLFVIFCKRYNMFSFTWVHFLSAILSGFRQWAIRYTLIWFMQKVSYW